MQNLPAMCKIQMSFKADKMVVIKEGGQMARGWSWGFKFHYSNFVITHMLCFSSYSFSEDAHMEIFVNFYSFLPNQLCRL